MERNIVEHCAPTLAGLKCGSLFYHRHNGPAIYREIRDINLKLRGKGISATILRSSEGGHLVYVYRKNMVEESLSCARYILRDLGYDHIRPGYAIKHLRSRIAESKQLPSEIGIFLGYPVDDVIGFMENKGRNCKCMGCWKVYGDEEHANTLFLKYRKCRMIYRERYNIGTPVEKLTIHA